MLNAQETYPYDILLYTSIAWYQQFSLGCFSLLHLTKNVTYIMDNVYRKTNCIINKQFLIFFYENITPLWTRYIGKKQRYFFFHTLSISNNFFVSLRA